MARVKAKLELDLGEYPGITSCNDIGDFEEWEDTIFQGDHLLGECDIISVTVDTITMFNPERFTISGRKKEVNDEGS